MSNLVEIAKDLEYVPDEQLIQLANGSDPRFPPFVVISEIKRRTDMRNRASEPMPKTTVAQEMVQEFATPSRQGLEGMSQDATGILPPTVYNRDMPSSMMADGGLTGYADRGKTEFTPTYVVPGGYYANPKFIDAVDRGDIFIGGPNEFRYMKPERAGDTAYNYLMNVKGEPERVIRRPLRKNFDSAGDAILEGLKEAGNIMFNPFPNEFRENITDTEQLQALVERREEKKKERREMEAEVREDYSRKLQKFVDDKKEARDNRFGMSEQVRNQFQKEYRAIIENAKAKNLPPEFTTLQLEGLQRKYERLAPFQEITNLAGIIGITPKFNPFVEDGKRIKGKDMIKRVEGKQEGGLTGYQTGNQTALTNTFIYGDNYANNLADYQDMVRKTRTMDQREQALLGSNLSYPMLNTTPDFDIDMSGISALQTTQEDLDAQLQIDSNTKSFDYLSKQLEEAKENLKRQKEIGDRGGLGGGTSYIEQAQERVDRIEKMLRAKQNQKDFVADAQAGLKESVMQEEELLAQALKKKEEDDAKKLAELEAKKEKELFANMDLNIPERTQTPRTEAQMKQQLNADVLMTVGTAIGSSTTPSQIFEKLSGLPSQLAATRKEQREEVKDFEDTRRADALAKLNIQIALKKLDQAQEQAKLKGDANDIAAINAIADVLSGTLDTDSSRYKAAERALDRIILKLSGNEADTKGIAALSELLIPTES